MASPDIVSTAIIKCSGKAEWKYYQEKKKRVSEDQTLQSVVNTSFLNHNEPSTGAPDNVTLSNIKPSS